MTKVDLAGFRRFGIYVVPEGAFFGAASAWLGWDCLAGQAIAHPKVGGLPATPAELTETPRKYGFHGTIKPPFVLAEGQTAEALDEAALAFCAGQPPVTIPQLTVRPIGTFVAIVPTDPSADLATLAAATVEGLDAFRAPPSDTELARRRKAGLTARQEELLQAWGYPYVMDEFRFHLTLTGRTEDPADIASALQTHFADVVPTPFVINSLCLMGEDAAGKFHLIRRYTFTG